jgi:hypothetical protein
MEPANLPVPSLVDFLRPKSSVWTLTELLASLVILIATLSFLGVMVVHYYFSER